MLDVRSGCGGVGPTDVSMREQRARELCRLGCSLLACLLALRLAACWAGCAAAEAEKEVHRGSAGGGSGKQCGMCASPLGGAWENDVQLYFVPPTPQAAALHHDVGEEGCEI